MRMNEVKGFNWILRMYRCAFNKAHCVKSNEKNDNKDFNGEIRFHICNICG